ncbi:hypothetical protein [Microseira wollei]|uniref:hypothetical protein n=1 Tax=Microseira wollei TaxID=467598 RepID=UPI001CFC8D18|nr:hypothetical protein [Microseira wollei]
MSFQIIYRKFKPKFAVNAGITAEMGSDRLRSRAEDRVYSVIISLDLPRTNQGFPFTLLSFQRVLPKALTLHEHHLYNSPVIASGNIVFQPYKHKLNPAFSSLSLE